MKNEVVEILIERDGLSNAWEAVVDAKRRVAEGEDPEEILQGS